MIMFYLGAIQNQYILLKLNLIRRTKEAKVRVEHWNWTPGPPTG